MSTFVIFCLLGLTSGALTGLLALGVVITYRATKVVNFASTAMGAISSYICYELIQHGVPGWAGLVVGIAAGALLGAFTHFVLLLVRRSSVLVKFIVTLGLFSGAESATLLFWGADTTSPASLLPTTPVHIGSLDIGVDRFILLGAALVLAGALSYVYRKTLFGLATSAVADSPLFTASSGWSTAAIQLTNFVGGGALTAAAMIFLTPLIGLNGETLSLLILPALAAALAGQFASFPWTMVAALLIGVTESLLSLYSANIGSFFGVSALSISSLPTVVPVVVIIVLTLARGTSRLRRGEEQPWLPRPGDGKVPLLPLGMAVIAAIVFLLSGPSAGWADALIATAAGGMLVLSIVLVTGIGGQFSLCQYALAGFGGWAAARFSAGDGVGFVPALLIGTVAAMLLALIVAQAAMRARGMVLAVATLGVALLLNAVIFTNSSLTGGPLGLTIPTPDLFGLSLDPLGDPPRYAAFGLALLLLAGIVVANVRRGRTGRRMLAVRSDERSAAALGIGVRSVKTYAFMLGGAVAGLAGVYLTFQFPTTDFTQYDTVSSVTLVQFAVLGGLGWVGASVAGGIGTTGALLPYLVIAASGDASSINTWFALVAGFVLPFVLRQSPDGIASVIAVGFNRPESEQERQRLHIARPVWRLAGMLEVLTAGCFILAAVVRTLGLIGAASGVVVTSALLIREMGNRRSRGAAGPWRRQPLVAVSVIAACIVMGVLAKWGGWLPVFLVGQVLSAIMARRGTARLSRRFMDRLRFPRERELEHDPAPVPRREPLSLEVRGLSVRFGGVVALEGFDLVVRPGEIVGLIGPNGAGKTTALDAITGFTRPSAGEVRVGGRLTTNWSPEKLARAGVIRSWQAVGLFDAMTVEENLLVAAEAHSPVHYLSDLVRPGVPRRTQAVDGVVREFQLEPWLAHRRSELPQGIARLVAIGRAICANPSLLLLDEPTAGLDAVEASEIFRSVRRVAQRTGIGILVVEHDVPLMLGLCQRLVVLDFGRKIADGPSQMVSEDARVVSAYMGVGSELPAQGPTPRLAT